MDTSKINFNHLPKYAPNNDSILPAHDVLNPGPEMSKYDVQRHESMKLRYGKRILSTRSMPQRICCKCGTDIVTSDSVVVNGLPFHGKCFVNARS